VVPNFNADAGTGSRGVVPASSDALPRAGAGGHLRIFQRRVRQWRLAHGPPPEVIFPQTHPSGEVMQFDWTHAVELEGNGCRPATGSPARAAGEAIALSGSHVC